MVALFGFCEWLCEDFFAQLFGEEVLDLDDEDDDRFATLEFLGLDLDACACVKDAGRKYQYTFFSKETGEINWLVRCSK